MNNQTMSEKAIQARREYKRKWNAAHPEKVRAYQEKYWENRARLAMESEREGRDTCNE